MLRVCLVSFQFAVSFDFKILILDLDSTKHTIYLEGQSADTIFIRFTFLQIFDQKLFSFTDIQVSLFAFA